MKEMKTCYVSATGHYTSKGEGPVSVNTATMDCVVYVQGEGWGAIR